MVFSGELASLSGLVNSGHPKLPPVPIQRQNRIKLSSYKSPQFVSNKMPTGGIQHVQEKHADRNHVTGIGGNHHQLSFDDELPEEPFWLSLIKEAIWGLRSLFGFLVEQPRQLKCIEWPSFKSTLRTAILSLVLVAIFIVALSSVDSGLSYLLALVLRRTL